MGGDFSPTWSTEEGAAGVIEAGCTSIGSEIGEWTVVRDLIIDCFRWMLPCLRLFKIRDILVKLWGNCPAERRPSRARGQLVSLQLTFQCLLKADGITYGQFRGRTWRSVRLALLGPRPSISTFTISIGILLAPFGAPNGIYGSIDVLASGNRRFQALDGYHGTVDDSNGGRYESKGMVFT